VGLLFEPADCLEVLLRGTKFVDEISEEGEGREGEGKWNLPFPRQDRKRVMVVFCSLLFVCKV
jgi:hypothetical protein